MLQECTSEIEDLVTDNELRLQELKPVVQDSPHPYEGIKKLSGRVRVPGAENLRIEFDENCSTEYGHDILTIMNGNGRTLAVRSGSDSADWKNHLRITGDEVRWNFTAQSKGTHWGWRLTAYPLTAQSSADLTELSDHTTLAVPSLKFAAALLGLCRVLLGHLLVTVKRQIQ